MLTDSLCDTKYTEKTFCNHTVTMGAELSEHSWVQLPERQEVKIGASAYHGFYLQTWDYIILFNLFTCQLCPHWQSPGWSVHCLISVLLANFPMKYNTYQYFMNSLCILFESTKLFCCSNFEILKNLNKKKFKTMQEKKKKEKKRN